MWLCKHNLVIRPKLPSAMNTQQIDKGFWQIIIKWALGSKMVEESSRRSVVVVSQISYTSRFHSMDSVSKSVKTKTDAEEKLKV